MRRGYGLKQEFRERVTRREETAAAVATAPEPARTRKKRFGGDMTALYRSGSESRREPRAE